jgi:ABC-type multidrug transport system fused ATPase/permease subunit
MACDGQSMQAGIWWGYLGLISLGGAADTLAVGYSIDFCKAEAAVGDADTGCGCNGIICLSLMPLAGFTFIFYFFIFFGFFFSISIPFPLIYFFLLPLCNLGRLIIGTWNWRCLREQISIS